MWDWQKNTQVDQCNKTQSPERDSHKHGQLIFDKEAKVIDIGAKIFSLTNSVETTVHPHSKNWSRHKSSTFHKNELKVYYRPKCKMQIYKSPKR